MNDAKFAVLADVDITCSGASACEYAGFTFEPPLLARSEAHLVCKGGGACDINAETAGKVTVDCVPDIDEYVQGAGVCSMYINAPILPFEDVYDLDLSTVDMSDVVLGAVTVNCHGFGCIGIGVGSVFGRAPVVFNNATWSRLWSGTTADCALKGSTGSMSAMPTARL